MSPLLTPRDDADQHAWQTGENRSKGGQSVIADGAAKGRSKRISCWWCRKRLDESPKIGSNGTGISRIAALSLNVADNEGHCEGTKFLWRRGWALECVGNRRPLESLLGVFI